MRVRITHLDGKLPNLALMRLSAYHKERGDDVYFTRQIMPSLDEGGYDRVYASAIFTKTDAALQAFIRQWPGAIVGGTGTLTSKKIEDVIGEFPRVDYSIYPDFQWSIGFTQRGCRLKCAFCVVPKKEGRVRQQATLAEIWRGEGHPKNIVLLDNDFFGNPAWRERAAEAIDCDYKICISQGINIRLINRNIAEAIASLPVRDGAFKRRKLYVAWDNIGDESIFFRGVNYLEDAGFPPAALMSYMLVGYDANETDADIFYRIDKMRERGIDPYPMPYNSGDAAKYAHLKRIQRWVRSGVYKTTPFSQYDTRRNRKAKALVGGLF